MHFDAGYREEAVLRDGTTVELRLVQPGDKRLFIRGMERLSPQSRYLRFFTPKDHLTDRELSYLTEVDQRTHFALGAVRATSAGDEGLGVARFVIVEPEPAVAEAAIAVIDEMHGQGLGRLLFLRLVAAARERGVTEFRAEILADNTAMRDLLRAIAPNSVEHADGSVVVIQLPIPPIEADASPLSTEALGPIYRLFAMVAERLVHIRALFDELIEITRRRE